MTIKVNCFSNLGWQSVRYVKFDIQNYYGDGDAAGHVGLSEVQFYTADVCTPAPSGLVSWWGGDDNALDIVGTNNGTLQGSATYASGKVGQAFSFDGGEDNYVEIPNSSSLNPTGAFSVDGWFYIDPSASGNAGEIATLVAKTEGSTNNGWALYFDDRWSTKSLKFVLGSILRVAKRHSHG